MYGRKTGNDNGLSDTMAAGRGPAASTKTRAELDLATRQRRRVIAPRELRFTEGASAQPIRGRDGLYRRSLALADTAAAAVALSLVTVLAAIPHAGLLLVLAPAIVVINKIAGLYDRDALVLNKT